MSATYQLSFDFSDRDLQSTESKFQSVLECLNSIPAINAGGCGISALAIYRWCRENGIEVSDRPFVIISNDEWDVQHNNSLIEIGEIRERLEYPHIVIEIDGLLWDSTGNEEEDNNGNFSYWHERCLPIGEDDLLELINYSSWNPSFKRSNVRKIEYALGIDLSDVER